MKKTILVLSILAVTSFSSFSQTKQESIKHLFSLMKTESMLDNFVSPFEILQVDNESAVINNSLMSSLKPMINKIMNEDMVELYDKYYSEKEIKEMIRFYKSKTGQKMIVTTPELQKEIMGIIQTKFMSDFMGEFMRSPALKSEITINTQSNNSADSISIAEMEKEYLDMDTSNLQNATVEEQQVLMKAIERMDSYAKFEDNAFIFTVKGADEVNMSERLFEYLKEIMEMQNSIIKDINFEPDENDPTIMRAVPGEKEK